MADTARSAQNRTNNAVKASTARISSGNRITAASDDVASLAISTNIRTKLTKLRSALTNVTQASSMLQIADQALGRVSEVLQRQKELATRANSGSISNAERGFLSQEFRQLTSEIERLATATNFNNIRLLGNAQMDALSLAQTNTEAFNAILNTTSLQVSGGGNAVRSNTPIQAFNELTGATMAGIAAAGRLQFVDANGVLLADSAYGNINNSVHGSFSSFKFSDVVYGATGRASATLTATLNGVEYTGRVVSNAAARVILSNGDTHINMHVGNVNLTNGAQANVSVANIADLFKDTVIARTNTINNGPNFFGTALAGAIGSTTMGLANIRLTTGDAVNISNFQYLRNAGTANSNQISVEINGSTFIADNVRDLISGGTLQFRDESRLQVLSLNFSGLDANITNIRTRPLDRERFIDALNDGFATVRTAIEFATDASNINVQLNNATPDALYDGQSIDITTIESAKHAGTVLDGAIKRATALRANVGAVTSRLQFAGNVISSSINNQDAARATLADTDIAVESTSLAQSITKAEFATYAIAQANNLPETLLELLNGN